MAQVAVGGGPAPPNRIAIAARSIPDLSQWNALVGQMLQARDLARFSRATADLTPREGDTVSVKAGGFQVGGGLRVRF